MSKLRFCDLSPQSCFDDLVFKVDLSKYLLLQWRKQGKEYLHQDFCLWQNRNQPLWKLRNQPCGT